MDTLLELFAGGTLREGGSWGGQECLAFVPLQVRNMESAAWVCCLLAALVSLGFREDVSDLLQRSSLLPFRPTRLDRLLAVVLLGIWLYVLQSKIRIHSLVNLLQPCHLSLLLHALALTEEGPVSTLISIYSLPLVVGAWGALLVPDVTGLTPLEARLFFVQHYFLVLSPLYLLVHRNCTALRLSRLPHFVNANLLIALLHWVVYETVNVSLSVNVNFFLCPTPGILDLLNELPQQVIWPSYRTVLSVLLFILALAFSTVYVLVASLISRRTELQVVKSMHSD